MVHDMGVWCSLQSHFTAFAAAVNTAFSARYNESELAPSNTKIHKRKRSPDPTHSAYCLPQTAVPLITIVQNDHKQ